MNPTISTEHERALSFTEHAHKSPRKNQYQDVMVDCEQKIVTSSCYRLTGRRKEGKEEAIM